MFNGRSAKPWGSFREGAANLAPAPLRACARHHSSCGILRLRFNLPQPGVSIIRAAPHQSSRLVPVGKNHLLHRDAQAQSGQPPNHPNGGQQLD